MLDVGEYLMISTCVFIFDGLADSEIGLITYELHMRNKLPVRTMGLTGDCVTTGGGLRVLPEMTLDDLDVKDTSLVILPGGEMWNETFNETLAGWVIQRHEEGVVIAAICAATMFLAKTGIYDTGVKYTSNSLDYMKTFFPEYHGERDYVDTYAVSDQGVITASGAAPHEFAYQILKTLEIYDDKVLVEFAEFWNCRDVTA